MLDRVAYMVQWLQPQTPAWVLFQSTVFLYGCLAVEAAERKVHNNGWNGVEWYQTHENHSIYSIPAIMSRSPLSLP